MTVFVPQINIIIDYILTILEGMQLAIYPNVPLQRWSGGTPFEDLDINLSYRALRVSIESNGKKPRQMFGNSNIRMRANLVTSILYGIEVTELLGADKQGLESMMMADEGQVRVKLMSPTLFSGLSDQAYDRPVFDGTRRKISRAGQSVLEVMHDFEWSQPAAGA